MSTPAEEAKEVIDAIMDALSKWKIVRATQSAQGKAEWTIERNERAAANATH